MTNLLMFIIVVAGILLLGFLLTWLLPKFPVVKNVFVKSFFKGDLIIKVAEFVLSFIYSDEEVIEILDVLDVIVDFIIGYLDDGVLDENEIKDAIHELLIELEVKEVENQDAIIGTVVFLVSKLYLLLS